MENYMGVKSYTSKSDPPGSFFHPVYIMSYAVGRLRLKKAMPLIPGEYVAGTAWSYDFYSLIFFISVSSCKKWLR